MVAAIPATGTISLGIVIGWLVRYFIRRFEKFTPSVLSSILSLAFGGVALKFMGGSPETIWFYPIGVLVGLLLYHVLAERAMRIERDTAIANAQAAEAAKAKSPSTPPGAGGGGGGALPDKWKHEPLYGPIK